jgi:hypothetical protein
LALLYTGVGDTMPANVIDSLPTDTAADLIAQIQQLSEEEQLFPLPPLLPATRNDQDSTMLDPHPTKALIELTQGGAKIPTGQYGQMNTNAKLAFWYMIAERLGATMIGIPRDYQPSQSVISLSNSLKSLNTNDLVAFFKRIL